MGTGEFALPTFLSLYGLPHQVVGLFTQPDRKGRGHHHHLHPMKEAALEHGTPVFQPQNVNTPEALADLRSLKPDVCLVAAYGQILSKDLLQIPLLGAYNLHASLLPKYRGAAPVHYAILNGETETGVTIFRIEPKLDAGPIVGRTRLPIGEKETCGELESRLAESAVPLTERMLSELAEDRLPAETQDSGQATKAPRLKKQEGEIDWNRSAREIGWHVRAMQPWPSPYTFFHQPGQKPVRIILTDVEPVAGEDLPKEDPAHHYVPLAASPPGTVVYADRHRLVMQTGDGLLEILKLRPEGKRDMPAEGFLQGHSVRPGHRMGPKPLKD